MTKTPNLQITYCATSSLRPYATNPRTHSKAQLKKLMRSIEEFGWANPILIDDSGMVMCGHGRLLAAEKLGIAEVPTITLGHLSEAQRRAYILADNAIAEKAGWSKSLLKAELQGLLEIGYDVELTGFDTLEIDSLLSLDDGAASEEEEVELPDGEPPVTRLGDHWIIGEHHLVCADARLSTSYEALLAGELAELVFTDPPYNVRIVGNVSGLGKTRHDEFVMGSGELSDAEFSMQLLRPALRNVSRHCRGGAIAFVCMDWRGAPQLLDAADGVMAELKNLIVFVKTNAGMGSFYRSQYELIYAFKVSPGPTINNFGLGEGGRHRSNVWTYEAANTFRRGRLEDLADHPTVKPKKLVEDAILDCSRRGGVVLDPFLGSGTTLAAAEATGRRGYGLELDPAYADVILRRLSKATGATPHLLDGTQFDDVARLRASEEGC
jgi:DNA modification methylase